MGREQEEMTSKAINDLDEEAVCRAQERAVEERAVALVATGERAPCHCGAHWCIEDDRYRAALEKIAALSMPYREFHSAARHIARSALSSESNPEGQ